MNKTQYNPWKSKQPENLPDFIIGGAMKSGTTSLHAILNNHPDISITHNELGFFDIDSVLQHPDFNFYNTENQTWVTQSMKDQPELLWNWYYSQFAKIKNKGPIIGEDSTTYLSSETAAKRIALQDKPIKLIFILRHPTKRVISNYLHLLKSGRAIYSLEDTLRYNPNSIIRRSLYKEQLENYYKHIPFERIKVVLFEDFIQNKEQCIGEICDFLGLDFQKLDTAVFDTHANKTKIPKRIKLQLLRNKLLQKRNNYRYSIFLPIKIKVLGKVPLRYRMVDKLHKKMNPKTSDYSFKPSESTLNFLDNFFKQELEGLDGLINKDACSKWFK
ncbi:MAG: sulfotransferase [Flavobacteriaceae bacterium]|nr:sulfotransferase [Flavobacteriaceae bacterium]